MHETKKEQIIQPDRNVQGILWQFLLSSLLLVPVTLWQSEYSLRNALIACAGPLSLVIGTRILMTMQKYRISDDAIEILPKVQYDHSYIEKSRIMGYEIIELTKMQQIMQSTSARGILMKYDKYEETYLYSTDPELIQWLESAVSENGGVDYTNRGSVSMT